MKWAIKFAVFCSLGAAVIFGTVVYFAVGDMGLDMNGAIAFALGVGLTILLAVGLMTAMFYSSRSGTDDAVYKEFDSSGKRRRNAGKSGKP